MESYSEMLITPSRIKQMIPSGISLGVGDDFFIARLQEKPQYKYLRYPFRVDCYMAALGFIKDEIGKYHNGMFEVADVLPKNVLKDTTGDFFVIDVEIKRTISV